MTSSTSSKSLSLDEKRAMIADLLKKKNIKPKWFPLSYEQQRLYFVQQLESDSWHYNIPYALRMTGPLQVQPLERALAEIITRHEVLRTTFSLVDGNPVQVIGPPQQLILPLLDLTALSQSEAERELRRLLDDQARQLFDLMRGPVVRACLVRLLPREHVLALTMHHIVSDAWSMEVMARELGLLYDAFAQGKESPLPRLTIQYADYAVWQREWLQGEVVERQLGYWKQRLAGAPVLELPSLGPRPGQLTQEGGKVRLRIGEQVTRGLRELSRREGVTLFMTMMAGYVVLLHRYSGQEDIVVGTPISGRRRLETEELMGMFLNMLAMRIDVSGNPRFVELMRRVRKEALGGYANQDVPYDKVVEQAQRERDNGRTPLIQASLVVQHEARQQWELGGMRLSSEEVDTGRTKFDISLIVKEEGEEMEVVLQYRKQMYEGRMVERMVRQLERVMEAVVKDEEARVGEIEMMSKEEREEVIQGWNDTRREYGESRCVHEIFEQEAERGADKVAVIFDDQQLTYGELNRRANNLAHRLRELGVGAEVRVGIYVERSLEMVVGLIGIMKAGGAYVPLDAGYPQERLRYILEDTKALVVLTQRELREGVEWAGVEVLELDREKEEGRRGENPSKETGSGNAAYVIYTSGSTGQPKGVVITHSALVNLLLAMQEEIALGMQDRFFSVTRLTFDIAALELYLPLIIGGQVQVSKELTAASSDFKHILNDSQATVMQTTPSGWRFLMNAGWNGEQRMKLLCGGEALESDLTLDLLKYGADVWNVYGPTETTVWSLLQRLQEAAVGATIPIGRPIGNTQVYILDKFLQPVPVAVAGELYIGGAGLARGYLNRPELTAEKFVPNPFSSAPGERLYRTGDLARYQNDGKLVFLGRIDQQVKIRGYRLELGEIEAVLRQHPEVEQAVVTVKQEADGDKRLVGYVVSRHEPGPSAEQLRGYLKGKLPEYMVPSFWVMMEQMPLTGSGKVDRKGLPEPEIVSGGGEEYREAKTPTEELIGGIWEEVLKVGRVGRHESFFDIGGHSLLAMQVVSRIYQVFHLEIPIRTLFDRATIAELAATIDSLRGEGKESKAIKRVTREGELPSSFNQDGRLLFEWLASLRSQKLKPAHLSLGLYLDGQLNVDAMQEALNEIVRRHDALRTSFPDVSNLSPLEEAMVVRKLRESDILDRVLFNQQIHSNVTASLSVRSVLLSATDSEENAVRRLAIEEIEKPFKHDQPPLMRATLLRIDSERHLLIMVLDHLICDAWSLRVLRKEMETLYEYFSQRQASYPLPELSIQDVDFASWQRELLRGDTSGDILSYWKQQAAEFGAAQLRVSDLPFAGAVPKNASSPSGYESITLDSDFSHSMRKFARQNGLTLYMLCLAGITLLLHAYSRKERIAIWGMWANRTRPETEHLIGWLADVRLLGMNLSSDSPASKFLKHVRDVVFEANANQEAPVALLLNFFLRERLPARDGLDTFGISFDLVTSGQTDYVEMTDGLVVRFAELPVKATACSIDLVAIDGNQEITLVSKFVTDRFLPSQIRMVLEDLSHILAKLLATPDDRISSFYEIVDRRRPATVTEKINNKNLSVHRADS